MKYKRFLTFLTSILICSSCSSSITYHKPITPLNTHQDEEGDFYTRKSAFRDSYFEICNQGTHYLPSTGDQRILVIPVEFSDYPARDLKGGVEGSLTYIHNAFFGDKSKTFYESVASYYNKSSYGQLTISGKVSPWFSLNKTVQEMENLITYQVKSQYILEQAIEWYRHNFDDIDDFDQDKDGYIDAVWLIYSAPFNNRNESFLWAHTYNSKGTSTYSDKPFGSLYSWASYHFMFYATNKPETHVYIHETGHMLGLKDYYSEDANEQYLATARFDMMDVNIGDHNAFSKILLNWTTPYVIQDEGVLELHSFEKTGECIVISPSWKNTVMDEYLLLEYYTPTGLHKADTTTNWEYQNLKESGLRVYHVDARLGYITNFGNKMHGYYDEITDPKTELPQELSTYHLDFAHNNTTSLTQTINGKPCYLLSLLWAQDFEKEGSSATNSVLYQTGSCFDDRLNYEAKPFAFHSFPNIPFTFKVLYQEKNKIALSFQKCSK